MILLSLLAAAAPAEASPVAASVSAPTVTVSDDMRCVTMFLLAAGSSKGTDQAAAVTDAIYFIGRSEGHLPDADLGPQASALITGPDYFEKQLPADAERCTKEVEAMSKRLDAVGNALTALSKAGSAASVPPAKPEPGK